MTEVSDYRSLLSNYTWDPSQNGAAIVLTYSFSTAPTSTVASSNPAAAASFHPLTAGEQATVQAALAQWSAVSGITFVQTTRTPGDLTFGFYNLATMGEVGDAGVGYFPQPGTSVAGSGPLASATFNPVGGDVYFDNSYQTNSFYFPDFAHVAIHEIGHAIGLKHPFDPAPTGPSYTLVDSLDNGNETVMAYGTVRLPNLGPLDVGAVQYIYGSNTAAAHPFIDIYNPNAEALTVIGSAGKAQTLFGSGGDDTFYSLGANDALSGGEGNNIFHLAGRPASVNGGSGFNTAYTGLTYVPTLVAGVGSSRSIYLPAYGGSQYFYNVGALVFTNGVYTTATSSFAPYSAAAYSAVPMSVAAANSVVTVANGTVNVGAYRGGTITVTGSGTVTTSAGGVETIRLGSGPGTVSGSGQDTVFGGAGPSTVLAGSGADLVVGGAGALTVQGGSGSSTVFGGAGGLTYTGGTGTDTVVAGSAPATIIGGSGGGTYFGGGHGSIIAGVGAQAVLIGADGDTLFSAGPAGDLFGASGPGTVTMTGVNSSGNDVFFGGGSTGTLNFVAGEGNDVMGLGQGLNSVLLGAGSSTVFCNAGSMSMSTITAGTGSAAIGLGGRSVEVVVNAMPTGAARTIALYNFVPGVDHVAAVGFAPVDVAGAVAGQVSSGGSTMVTLADHSTLQFVGVGRVDAGAFG